MTLLAAVSAVARKRRSCSGVLELRPVKRYCSESTVSCSPEVEEDKVDEPLSDKPLYEKPQVEEPQMVFNRLGEAIECVAMAQLGLSRRGDAACANAASQDEGGDKDKLRDFRAVCLPSFSFGAYVARLAHYLSLWKAKQDGISLDKAGEFGGEDVAMRSLLIGLVYVDRMLKMNQDAVLCPFTLHRLVSVATLLAAKYTEDRPVSNRFWAQVAGVPLPELNLLEQRLCALLKFQLFVREEDFFRVQSQMSF